MISNDVRSKKAMSMDPAVQYVFRQVHACEVYTSDAIRVHLWSDNNVCPMGICFSCGRGYSKRLQLSLPQRSIFAKLSCHLMITFVSLIGFNLVTKLARFPISPKAFQSYSHILYLSCIPLISIYCILSCVLSHGSYSMCFTKCPCTLPTALIQSIIAVAILPNQATWIFQVVHFHCTYSWLLFPFPCMFLMPALHRLD